MFVSHVTAAVFKFGVTQICLEVTFQCQTALSLKAHTDLTGYNYIESLRAHWDEIALIMSSAYLYLKLNTFHITMTSRKNIILSYKV